MNEKPSLIEQLRALRTTMLIYAGVLFTVLASLVGLVIEPERQLGGLEQADVEIDAVTGETAPYPRQLEYGEALGRQVYISMGCIYCHSQQVRPEGFGADFERGWGNRRTVAQDYILDQPHLLGTMRTGPDLANIAVRQPSYDWHHLHLYNPRLTSPGSIMPAFAFMYEEVEVAEGDDPPDGAVAIPNTDGAYIVPKRDAEHLYDYLMTLDRQVELPEPIR